MFSSKPVICCNSMKQEVTSVPSTPWVFKDVCLVVLPNPRCPQAKDTPLTPCKRVHPTRWITPVTHSRFKVRRRTATPMNAAVDTTTETPQLTLALLFLLLPQPRTWMWISRFLQQHRARPPTCLLHGQCRFSRPPPTRRAGFVAHSRPV